MHGNKAIRTAAIAMSALLSLSACTKKDAATTDSGMTVGTADTGMTAMPAPAAAMSDANIFYALDRANMMDSAAGATASTKGTSADVRDFGKMMMADHHQMRMEGQNLAKKLAVVPEAPANDQSQVKMDATAAMLTGAAKGKDFDKAYIDGQVTDHKGDLETATMGMNAAQNAELKNMIQKAAPKIQAHLDRAQVIQTNQNKM